MATDIPDPVAMARARAEGTRDVDKVRAVLLEHVMQRVATAITMADAMNWTSTRLAYRDLAPAVVSLPEEVVGAMMQLPAPVKGGAHAEPPHVIARLLDMEDIVYPHVRDRLKAKSAHYTITLLKHHTDQCLCDDEADDPCVIELDVGWAVPAAAPAGLSTADIDLVAQVMALTQERIDRLPAADRAKVVELRNMLSRHMM